MREALKVESIDESEARVVIPEVVLLILGQLQHLVTLPLIALAILHLHHHEQDDRGDGGHPDQPDIDGVSSDEPRSFVGREDVGRDDAADVAEADLHGGIDAALVVAAHVVGQPDQDNWLCNVSTGHDDEKCRVSARNTHIGLCHEDDQANRADADAEDDEGKPVTHSV